MVAFGPLLAGAAYTINFVADADADRISPVRKDIQMARQPFATGELSTSQGILLVALCLTLGLASLAWLGLVPFLAGLAVAVLGILYSVGPRLKTVPGMDVAASGLILALCYAGGRAAVEPLTVQALLPIAWVFLLVSATYLLTQILDHDADIDAGLRTSCAVLGVANTLNLSALLYLASIPLYVGSLLAERGLAYVVVAPGIALGLLSYARRRPASDPNAFRGFVRHALLAAGLGIVLIIVLYGALHSLDWPTTWG